MNTSAPTSRIRLAVTGLALAAALSLGASAPAMAAPVAPTKSVSAIQAGPVDAGWVYVCKTRTAWYDPFNWFGTARWSCATEWQ